MTLRLASVRCRTPTPPMAQHSSSAQRDSSLVRHGSSQQHQPPPGSQQQHGRSGRKELDFSMLQFPPNGAGKPRKLGGLTAVPLYVEALQRRAAFPLLSNDDIAKRMRFAAKDKRRVWLIINFFDSQK